MKGLAFLLIAVILLHSACIGRCWGEAAAAPPCHQQEDDDATLCSQGPAIEAKTAPAAEPITLPMPAALAFVLLQNDSALQFEIASPPLLRLTVLRI